MRAQEPTLVARVTEEKSAGNDRFQCTDVYQLWDSGEVTIDHCIEDEEWGAAEETRETTEGKKLPKDFFKAGVSRVIDHAGSIREKPL